MNLLLHTCCGPCSIYPLRTLRELQIDVTGFFYNPNIHPYREFRKRVASLRDFAEKSKFNIKIEDDYGLTEYLQKIVFHENDRCPLCYAMRLKKTAQYGISIGAEAFSTTLLYSKYQNHQAIIEIGKKIAEKYGIEFYYKDFRKGWQEGIDSSIAMNLYRQPYCGCIYSEQERYDKKLKKVLRAHSDNNS